MVLQGHHLKAMTIRKANDKTCMIHCGYVICNLQYGLFGLPGFAENVFVSSIPCVTACDVMQVRLVGLGSVAGNHSVGQAACCDFPEWFWMLRLL